MSQSKNVLNLTGKSRNKYPMRNGWYIIDSGCFHCLSSLLVSCDLHLVFKGQGFPIDMCDLKRYWMGIQFDAILQGTHSPQAEKEAREIHLVEIS